MKNVYIVGAHSRGRTLKAYLEYLYPDVNVVAFLVDDMSNNPRTADGIPVRIIGKDLNPHYPVYIGTRGIHHQKITAELSSIKMQEIIPVTVELDRKLRNEYVRKYFENNARKFLHIDELSMNKEDEKKNQGALKKTAKIYVAKSIADEALRTTYEMTKDEAILQVGASLTEKRFSKNGLVDCVGENISDKNKQYCELTGLYWVWKHATEDYVGLVHYRRHFLLPDGWLQKVMANGVDVILPVPLYVAPNIEGNYKERHFAPDWDFLMDYFKTKMPWEYEDTVRIFSGNLYSPCNMLIARKEVLNELCIWLFPILDAVAKHGGERKAAYDNRYPGFISERLITYYFERHRDRYQIAYSDKNFLS